MKRYAAKLLFQFRVTVDGDSGKRRTCEERIVVMDAASGKAALARAKRKGKESQYRYDNSEGNPVSFEFIGVMDLLCLDPECEQDEVWYDIVERLLPFHDGLLYATFSRRTSLVSASNAITSLTHGYPALRPREVSGVPHDVTSAESVAVHEFRQARRVPER